VLVNLKTLIYRYMIFIRTESQFWPHTVCSVKLSVFIHLFIYFCITIQLLWKWLWLILFAVKDSLKVSSCKYISSKLLCGCSHMTFAVYIWHVRIENVVVRLVTENLAVAHLQILELWEKSVKEFCIFFIMLIKLHKLSQKKTVPMIPKLNKS